MESNASDDPSLVLREDLPLPRPYRAPTTPIEEQLAEIWRMVLGMDRVGVEDSYDDLGGDSFHATLIFDMIAEAFGVVVPIAMLIDAPTIVELAAAINDLHRP